MCRICWSFEVTHTAEYAELACCVTTALPYWTCIFTETPSYEDSTMTFLHWLDVQLLLIPVAVWGLDQVARGITAAVLVES